MGFKCIIDPMQSSHINMLFKIMDTSMTMTILYPINILICKQVSNWCVSPKLLTNFEICNLFEENKEKFNA